MNSQANCIALFPHCLWQGKEHQAQIKCLCGHPRRWNDTTDCFACCLLCHHHSQSNPARLWTCDYGLQSYSRVKETSLMMPNTKNLYEATDTQNQKYSVVKKSVPINLCEFTKYTRAYGYVHRLIIFRCQCKINITAEIIYNNYPEEEEWGTVKLYRKMTNWTSGSAMRELCNSTHSDGNTFNKTFSLCFLKTELSLRQHSSKSSHVWDSLAPGIPNAC